MYSLTPFLDRDSIVGEPRRMHDEQAALHLLQNATDAIGLILDDRELLRKNDIRKAAIAWILSTKTSVKQRWISQQLGMGSCANVSRAIHRVIRGEDSGLLELKQKLEIMYRCVH